MSLAKIQKTCAKCALPLAGERTSLEPLVDDVIRYVVVHWGCSTFVRHTIEPAIESTVQPAG
jgi:hypothetical protein